MTAELKPVAGLDVMAVRRQFPILTREVNGKPLVYLDSAASAQKPEAVIEGVGNVWRHSYANVHRGLHTLANEATEAFEASRGKLARFLGAASPDQIVFTRGATEAINLVADSFGATLKEGDEIIVSQMEHHSNIVPWHFLRERKGVVLKWAPVTDDGALDMAAFESLLTERTKMVAITHMSNVMGTVSPIEAIVEKAHAVGAAVLVDGSQGAVHMPVDVQALGCDFYVVTGHKLYGPNGVGALYASGDWLDRLRPYQGGGEMIAEVREDGVVYADVPHKFEAGTPVIAEVIGLGAALDWLTSLDRIALMEHERQLMDRFEAGLADFEGVTLLGRTQDKGAITSFSLEGAHPHDLAQLMDKYGVAVRAGHHCAHPLMQRFGVVGTVRASFAAYNNEADVDAALEALRKAKSFLI
ncbi:MAG: cysteine desulfurase [Oceanicaulis sp.]|mgnify:CR=1 FL=1|uniref:aminotransferase class V-fold PLP-dependent enzyme n=1 Tax=unclassified Oceanicaulis TaxID=2632123 RepID=UPI000C422A20|nr:MULTISPECIES: cysteine desulfurase [unclassified Oceanicaulis]MAB70594.1 cysteine desulfurase [Oceanicaulis sp.]MBC39228.1 cysteine desulfurase [Oceanicaulis sp.]HBU61312.1 cysteine desulfurase [Oceanicaulis sp.]